MSGRINGAAGEATYMAALVESQQLQRKEHAATRRTLHQTELASKGIDEALDIGEHEEKKRAHVVAWVKAGVAVAATTAKAGKAGAQGGNVSNADWEDKWSKSPDKWTKGRADGPRNLAAEKKELRNGLIEKAPDVPLDAEEQRKEFATRGSAQLRERGQSSQEALAATKEQTAEAVEEQRDIGRKLLQALNGQLEDE